MNQTHVKKNQTHQTDQAINRSNWSNGSAHCRSTHQTYQTDQSIKPSNWLNQAIDLTDLPTANHPSNPPPINPSTSTKGTWSLSASDWVVFLGSLPVLDRCRSSSWISLVGVDLSSRRHRRLGGWGVNRRKKEEEKNATFSWATILGPKIIN